MGFDLGSIVTGGIAALVKLFLADNGPLRNFYTTLYSDYNPDITGYTLMFMIPPEFSAVEYAKDKKLDTSNSILDMLSDAVGIMPKTSDTLEDFANVYPFFATDFTPPVTQVQNAQVQSRTGALSYAADIYETNSVSIQFLESNPLTIYKFHLLWVEYMRDILRGAIKPAIQYLDDTVNLGYGEDHYGTQDYLASFYIVKYRPDMMEESGVIYIGKCTGVYPLSLPSKDLIGNRLTNEITMLPFEYSCIAYREYTKGLKSNEYLLNELKRDVLDKFNWFS